MNVTLPAVRLKEGTVKNPYTGVSPERYGFTIDSAEEANKYCPQTCLDAGYAGYAYRWENDALSSLHIQREPLDPFADAFPSLSKNISIILIKNARFMPAFLMGGEGRECARSSLKVKAQGSKSFHADACKGAIAHPMNLSFWR